jgi:hypothetical protein
MSRRAKQVIDADADRAGVVASEVAKADLEAGS